MLSFEEVVRKVAKYRLVEENFEKKSDKSLKSSSKEEIPSPKLTNKSE